MLIFLFTINYCVMIPPSLKDASARVSCISRISESLKLQLYQKFIVENLSGYCHIYFNQISLIPF